MVLGVSLGGHAAWYVSLVASLFQIHNIALQSPFTSRDDPAPETCTANLYDNLDLAMLTPTFL